MSVLALFVATLALQVSGAAPLRKSDLVRLLSGAGMSSGELAQLVRHNCLTFEPTPRDRNDLRQMGADDAMLAAVDACARRTTRRATPPPPRAAAPQRAAAPRVTAPPVVPPPPPALSTASASRSGFTAGGGQRGSAGSQLPHPVVFEVRDSSGVPVSRQPVAFTGINARVTPASVVTDALGQASAGVTLGERTGSATVIASVGVVEKQVAFNVVAGPAAQLMVTCGQASVAGHFAMRPDSIVLLRVAAQDAFANPTPLLGLRAAVADARIFRVVAVTQDSVAGSVQLKPDQAGTTSLAVIANGLRRGRWIVARGELPQAPRNESRHRLALLPAGA